jgi:hypothetical protein
MTMAASAQRVVQVAHKMPGRLRISLPWLRADRVEAQSLADHLASVGGMTRAEVRMRTGSVVCEYDEKILDEGKILSIVRRLTNVRHVLMPDETPPRNIEERTTSHGGHVGAVIEQAFRSANDEMLRVTDGRLDMGVAGAFAFLAAGVAEIFATGQIEPPPWFNLAWWAFRTFTIFPHGDENPAPSAHPRGPTKRKTRAASNKTKMRPRADRGSVEPSIRST